MVLLFGLLSGGNRMRTLYKATQVRHIVSHTRLCPQSWVQNHVCNYQLPSPASVQYPLMSRSHCLNSSGMSSLTTLLLVLLWLCTFCHICHKVLPDHLLCPTFTSWVLEGGGKMNDPLLLALKACAQPHTTPQPPYICFKVCHGVDPK